MGWSGSIHPEYRALTQVECLQVVPHFYTIAECQQGNNIILVLIFFGSEKSGSSIRPVGQPDIRNDHWSYRYSMHVMNRESVLVFADCGFSSFEISIIRKVPGVAMNVSHSVLNWALFIITYRSGRWAVAEHDNPWIFMMCVYYLRCPHTVAHSPWVIHEIIASNVKQSRIWIPSKVLSISINITSFPVEIMAVLSVNQTLVTPVTSKMNNNRCWSNPFHNGRFGQMIQLIRTRINRRK